MITVKKKTVTLIGNSSAYALTGAELQELCKPHYSGIIAQYLDLSADYPVITELSLRSGDEVIYEVIVIGTNGEGYIIISVSGVIYLLKV